MAHMTLDGILEYMDSYIQQERYEDLLEKFFYNELSEKNQEEIEISDEFTSDDIGGYIKDGELFTENKNYLNDRRNFMLFEDGGNVLVTIDKDGNASGLATGKFSFPLEDESAKKAFALMLLYLQECSKVKFPNIEFEVE